MLKKQYDYFLHLSPLPRNLLCLIRKIKSTSLQLDYYTSIFIITTLSLTVKYLREKTTKKL